MVVAAVLSAVSASSLLGTPLCPGMHSRDVGPGRALRNDLRFCVTGDRHSVALISDQLLVQIVSECSGWLSVAHSNAGCMAAASSANDECERRIGKVIPAEVGRTSRVARCFHLFATAPLSLFLWQPHQQGQLLEGEPVHAPPLSS